jgi:hypothetical protein
MGVAFEDVAIHVVDSAHGIYSPQVFIEKFKENLCYLDREDPLGETELDLVKEIEKGPEYEYYWDAWNDFTEMCGVRTAIGNEVFGVFENEGIFLIPVHLIGEIDWEELG